MKSKWFGIAGVFMIMFSLVLSSVAFAGGACCAAGGKKDGAKAAETTQGEEGAQVSEAE